ncbi:MAG: histidine phosphatase family protein [Gammaproteobacteria bacterium]|nr:histidine phosphatase family protein [Gammaproteobacteria bacterium]
MATIYMVRHGRADANAPDPRDPGLDDLGHRQARETAAALAPKGPLPIRSSPFARARETAAALAELWEAEVAIEPRVAEIPFPMTDLAERGAWLRRAMAGGWSGLDDRLQSWRRDLVDCVARLDRDCVVFCHFIAINVAAGAAQGDDRLVIFQPDNASVTVLSNDGGKLRLLEFGREAATKVN